MNAQSNILGWIFTAFLVVMNAACVIGFVFLLIQKFRPKPNLQNLLTKVWVVIVAIGFSALAFLVFKANLFTPKHGYSAIADYFAQFFLAPMCVAGVISLFLKPSSNS